MESEAIKQGRRREELDIGFWFPRPKRGARFAEELRKLGHQVIIYHSKPIPGNQSYVQKVPYHWRTGLKILMRTSHNVYYTSRSFLPVLQLCANRCITGRPYVYTLNAPIWAYYGERNKQLWMQKVRSSLVYPLLLRIVLWGAGAIVTNSHFLSLSLSKRFLSQSHKIKPIYNGVDFEAIEAGEEKPEAWPAGKIRFLSIVTANFKRKTDGVLLLLKAFQLISDRLLDATFFVAVKSDNTDEMIRVRKYLKKLPCAQRVRIDVNRQDIPDLLATADIFVYATPPDSSDSLPRVLLEAQDAGVPTVATDTVGCPEAVLDGISGYIVPYNAEALAQSVLKVIEDSENAAGMAKTARKIVKKKFAWEKMAMEYGECFLKVVQKQ